MPAAASRRARWGVIGGVALAVLAADQLTKWWAVEQVSTRTIDLVWTLRLHLTVNHGSAFSIAEGQGTLISLLALIVVAILLRAGRDATSASMAIAIGLVSGGAVGNLADRLLREGDGLFGGGVIDFIDLQWWPVFNLADAAIVTGAVLILVSQWRGGHAGGDHRA